MSATTAERLEFAPPPTPGLVRALALAIVAHALLLAVLAVGVQWKRDATPVTVEAELWSAIPEQAAPPAPEPAPPPPPAIPAPAPKPTVAPPAPPPPVPLPDPSIAIAKEKARLQKEKQAQQDKLEQEKRQKEALQKQKLQEAKDAREKAARDKALHDKEAREKTLADKAAAAKKLQQEQRAQDAKAASDARNVAQSRQQQLERIARMAGAATGNGDASSTGTAKQSSGPSAGYAGRLRARVKPNITYTEPISGNPAAEVEVRTAPTGTIINRKLVKSSGVKSWDDAVLNAIDKTETLPPDVDGRVPSSLILIFRPKD
jgi:colicin import membrane protein